MRNVPPAVLDDDPFWSVVRRRHPDVDVVLLGPATPPQDDADVTTPLPAATVREVALLVGQTWASLAPAVTRAAGEPRTPTVSWRQRGTTHPRHALVVTCGLPAIGRRAGVVLLRDVTGSLLDAGWAIQATTTPDQVARLDARGGVVDVRGEAGPGATVLRIASGHLHVDAGVRARIREEVTSWL